MCFTDIIYGPWMYLIDSSIFPLTLSSPCCRKASTMHEAGKTVFSWRLVLFLVMCRGLHVSKLGWRSDPPCLRSRWTVPCGSEVSLWCLRTLSTVIEVPLLPVVVRKALWEEVKLSIYWFVHWWPLTYRHKIWIITKRTRSWTKVAEIKLPEVARIDQLFKVYQNFNIHLVALFFGLYASVSPIHIKKLGIFLVNILSKLWSTKCGS